MKVYVNAFELRATDAALSIDQFFTGLVREGYKETVHSNRQRVLGFGSREGYLCAILLSTREQRNFVTIRIKNGRPIASLRRTRQGELMADVNYFVVNESTGSGVFSAYKGSGGMLSFGNLLGKLYRSEADELRDLELEEHGELGEEDGHATMALIKKKYFRAKLELIPMLTDPKFSADLNKFAKYTRFEYIEPTLRDSRYRPVAPLISKQRRILSFKTEGSTKTKIRKFLAGIVADSGISDGTVHGHLPSGEEYAVSINPEVYCLAKYPHDDVVTPDNIRLDKVATLPIIGKLLAEVKARKELFV